MTTIASSCRLVNSLAAGAIEFTSPELRMDASAQCFLPDQICFRSIPLFHGLERQPLTSPFVRFMTRHVANLPPRLVYRVGLLLGLTIMRHVVISTAR